MKVIAYKNVYERDLVFETDFETYLNNPEEIFEVFGLDLEETTNKIKSISDKQQRNNQKRNFLPAIELSQSGILAIDIDNISEKPDLKSKIVERLSKLKTCFVVKESVSGNIVAFFKYDCSVKDYPYLYYKLYLELTLLLGVTIDYLPEIGRLRYVGEAGYLYKNDESEIIVDLFEDEDLPIIKSRMTPNEARTVKYGSR